MKESYDSFDSLLLESDLEGSPGSGNSDLKMKAKNLAPISKKMRFLA